MRKNYTLNELVNHLSPVLIALMCEVTGLSRDSLSPLTSFDEIGLQSLSVVAFTRRLEAHFPDLPKTFLFDCRNLEEVAAYLADRYPSMARELAASSGAIQPGGEVHAFDLDGLDEWPEFEAFDCSPSQAQESRSDPAGYAVIGMDGRFPGASSLSEFWANLKDGVESVSEIPPERWSLEGFFEPSDGLRHPGRSYSKWGAFLSDVDCFDAKFFGIAPREAALMDPQERLFLEVSWNAMEDAGLLGERAKSLKGDSGYDVGVFLGLTTNTYALKGPDHWRKGNPEIPTSMPWSAANRVSYCLDLCGPSLTVDTACSASLVAIHLACESLERGECRAAIAGGVNLYLHPAKYIQLCQQQMLSPTGHCHSFGADADGFVPGEGAGVLVLKRLPDALRDGDRILAVVRGTAVNHNGRTNGYTVPRARSQAALIRSTLARASVSPESISYVEAHGTGTKLGDPIEISALADALGSGNGSGPCALGSVKSNIGHLESAAGVAGVIKTILQLQNRTLVPSLHAVPLNPAIDLDSTRIFIPHDTMPWSSIDKGPRRAGVSSFGAGGTNAHVIIEEAPPVEGQVRADGPLVFPLSARRRCVLDALAKALLLQLESMDVGPEGEPLSRLAYTLQCGRRHFEHRVAFVAQNKADLTSQVRSYITADTEHGAPSSDAATNVRPYVGFNTQPGAPPPDGGDAHSMAKAWAKGAPIDWQSFWLPEAPRPSEAPKYAFLKERHWLAKSDDEASPGTPGGARTIERSVCIPSSSSLFTEHVIGGRPLFPATAYIAYCHANAPAILGQNGGIEFRDLAWLRPVASTAGCDVEILVSAKEAGADSLVELRDARQPEDVCFKAALRSLPSQETAQILSLSEARTLCSSEADVDECYRRFEQAGMDYGPRFRCLEAAWVSEAAALAKICLRVDSSAAGPVTPLDPAMMDGVLHTASFLLDRAKGELQTPLVPFGAKRISILASPGREVFAYARRKPSSSNREMIFDFWVFGPDGRPLIRMEDFRFRYMEPQAPPFRRPDTSIQYLVPRWVEADAAETRRGPTQVLLFDVDTVLFDKIKAANPGLADTIQLAITGATFEVRDDDYIVWDPSRHADLLWRVLASSERMPQHLVFNIGSADVRELQRSARPAAGSALEAVEILRALCRSSASPKFHVSMIVDRRQTGEGDLGTALGGLLRSIQLELPGISAGVLELENGDSAAAAIGEIRSLPRAGITEARLVAGQRYERRLEVVSPAVAAGALPIFSADDAFIITGANGAVGRRLALLLSQKGVRRMALLGRSARNEKVATLLYALKRNRTDAEYWQADCSDLDAVRKALAEARDKFGSPTGVLHCAGVLKDGFFVRQGVGDLREACRAKILGAHWLDQLTAGSPVRWFIVCSALAGIRGNVGQSHYAFANSWLDRFAEQRNAMALKGERSGRSISIAWPHWSLAEGMQAPSRLVRQLEEAGIHPIDQKDGENILLEWLNGSEPVIIPVKGKIDAIERLLGSELKPPLMASPSRTIAPLAASDGIMAARSGGIEASHVEASILGFLANALGAVTGDDPSRLDPDAPMEVYGLDSIMVMELNERLEKKFPSLSKTAAFEARSLRGLAGLIAAEHSVEAHQLASSEGAPVQPAHVEAGSTAPAAIVAPLSTAVSDVRAGDIAIIGLAGRYPGAETLEEFWHCLASGKDLVTAIPNRWQQAEFGFGSPDQDERLYSRWGAFLSDFDKFDPLFFGISPREAERMDPQERLFLQTAWHAVEDAGYTPETLSGRRGAGRRRRVAVVAGVMYGEYQFFGAAAPAGSKVPLTNSSYASVANRVSFCLDLDGPSLAVDSMCSSSLYAIHIASELIKAGGCDLAIAGGVNLSLHHYKYRTLCELGFASSDGKCRSFGEGGDGYVPGEGVGAVLLKKADLAIRDKDHIYAIIRGSDIGHGGRGTGYTVPNAEAQADVIRGALDRAHIDPSRLSYIEAHGTGTSLGDPIEIRGLSKVLSKSFAAGSKCPIGSIKSNIGHLESAAGIAGLTKILLQMKHGQIAPSLHSGKLNGNIDFANLPFVVQRELGPWVTRDGGPRIAALSSFGAGGSNAHMMIEEYSPPAEPAVAASGEEMFCFSARTWKQLAAILDRYIRFLEGEEGNDGCLGDRRYTPAEVAATLLHGRIQLRARCAVVARDFPGLTRELTSCFARLQSLDGDGIAPIAVGPNAYLGEVADGPRAETGFASLRERASAWVEGRWSLPKDDAGQRRRKVPLPGYAFEPQSYWLWDLAPEQEVRPSEPSTGTVSPPLSVNAEITPEAILEKVERGVMDVADAQSLLNRLLEAEAVA